MQFAFNQLPFSPSTNDHDGQRLDDEFEMKWFDNMDPSLVNPTLVDPLLLNHSDQGGAQRRPISPEAPQQIDYPSKPMYSFESHYPAIQRFVDEPERRLFTAPNLPRNTLQQCPKTNSTPALSQTSYQSMASRSPSLSHGLLSSSGDAQSPLPETEYSYVESRYPIMGAYNGFPETPYQFHSLPQSLARGSHHVSMGQVQSFADTEDASLGSYGDFGSASLKQEYSASYGRADQQYFHRSDLEPTGDINTYCAPLDASFSTSIQGYASPLTTNSSDIDVNSPATEDPEYTPRSARTRKRGTFSKKPSFTSPLPGKRRRISKAERKSTEGLSCKICTHAPFKDAAALQRHVASAHTRAFVCVFAFAGCDATFASKNEWKRHVGSQHVTLNVWVCEVDGCGKPGRPGDGEFNRKDLFTQHLRRIHSPALTPGAAASKAKDPAWEERIRRLQDECLRTKRQPPQKLGCPSEECRAGGVFFEGGKCWDQWLEHVARHLDGGEGSVDAGRDDLLVNWALAEGIVCWKSDDGGEGGGGGRFGLGNAEADTDADAGAALIWPNGDEHRGWGWDEGEEENG